MSRVGQAQMTKLLDLLSEQGVLVHGKVAYTNTNKQNFWKRIAMQLNSVDGGVYKNTWKWCKMWSDWKNKTKKKANILLRKKSYNYIQQTPTLTNLELRLLKMIEYPIDNKILDMVDASDNITKLGEDFLHEDINNLQSIKDDKMSSDEEDNTALGYFANKNKYNVSNILDDEKFEEFGKLSDRDKIKKKVKKKKISLEEYKIKTTLALEKERVHQKSEELRLRALELKLKGDELKLKEIEMNKINYLTNIEEEKLKCFRDLSSSFKEFLERTRNGNLRFPNMI